VPPSPVGRASDTSDGGCARPRHRTYGRKREPTAPYLRSVCAWGGSDPPGSVLGRGPAAGAWVVCGEFGVWLRRAHTLRGVGATAPPPVFLCLARLISAWPWPSRAQATGSSCARAAESYLVGRRTGKPTGDRLRPRDGSSAHLVEERSLTGLSVVWFAAPADSRPTIGLFPIFSLPQCLVVPKRNGAGRLRRLLLVLRGSDSGSFHRTSSIPSPPSGGVTLMLRTR
jgi:hypothetical protein